MFESVILTQPFDFAHGRVRYPKVRGVIEYVAGVSSSLVFFTSLGIEKMLLEETT